MKKTLLIACFISICCLASCPPKSSYMPKEKEILAKVEEIVPVEYEHTNTTKEKNLTTCYFECKDRDLSFTAQGYVTDVLPSVPMPQFMAGYIPVISVSYWHQIQDMYFPEIRALFETKEFYKGDSDAAGYKEIEVLLRSEEELAQFVDLAMQSEEILKKELEYVDEAELIEHPIVHYVVKVSYIRILANGKRDVCETRCCVFTSNPTLEKDELLDEIKKAIEEKSAEITEMEYIMIYEQDETAQYDSLFRLHPVSFYPLPLIQL